MAKSDVHEGYCRTCGQHFRRNLTHVNCKDAAQESIFTQIASVIRPYCSPECLPARLYERLQVLLGVWEDCRHNGAPKEEKGNGKEQNYQGRNRRRRRTRGFRR